MSRSPVLGKRNEAKATKQIKQRIAKMLMDAFTMCKTTRPHTLFNCCSVVPSDHIFAWSIQPSQTVSRIFLRKQQPFFVLHCSSRSISVSSFLSCSVSPQRFHSVQSAACSLRLKLRRVYYGASGASPTGRCSDGRADGQSDAKEIEIQSEITWTKAEQNKQD